MSLRRTAPLALVVLGLAACANQGAPPGGEQDRLPPQVVETVPDTFAVVEPFTGAIRIKFNERISERVSGGDLDRAVQVSPRTGDVRVKHRRDGLEISVAGGFEAGLVYRVTVLPVVTDMFQNSMREAFEFVFSTGPQPLPSVLAGIVDDRITGATTQGISVIAIEADDEDGAQHVAETDSAGIYALRYLPAGTYRIQAFEDVNRNHEADRQEPRGEVVQTLVVFDTVLAQISILPPDTTEAVLASIEVVDSATMRIVFDDYLDPDSSVSAVGVILARGDGAAPRADSVMHWHEYQERMDSLRARVAADADVVAPRQDGLPEGRQPAAGSRGAQTPAGRPARGGIGQTSVGRNEFGRPFPGREIYVLLTDTLATETPYVVTVSGVTNIAGTTGGEGQDTVV